MKNAKGILAAALLAVIVGIGAWWMSKGRDAAPQEGQGVAAVRRAETGKAPAVAQETAAAPAAEAMGSTEETLAETPTRRAPEFEETSEPIVKRGAKAKPEIEDTIAAVNRALGWDKVDTIEITQTSTAGDVYRSRVKSMMRAPSTVFSVIEREMDKQATSMYQLTDGNFVEYGKLGPDGKRAPYGGLTQFDSLKNSSSPLWNDKLLDPALYDETETIKADPTQRMFQKADGTPIDNLDLVVLKGRRREVTFELYIDAATNRPVAVRATFGNTVYEDSCLKYAEVAPGIFYQVERETHARGPEVELGGKRLGEEVTIKTVVKPEDVKVNGAIDPAVFQFMAGKAK